MSRRPPRPPVMCSSCPPNDETAAKICLCDGKWHASLVPVLQELIWKTSSTTRTTRTTLWWPQRSRACWRRESSSTWVIGEMSPIAFLMQIKIKGYPQKGEQDLCTAFCFPHDLTKPTISGTDWWLKLLHPYGNFLSLTTFHRKPERPFFLLVPPPQKKKVSLHLFSFSHFCSLMLKTHWKVTEEALLGWQEGSKFA